VRPLPLRLNVRLSTLYGGLWLVVAYATLRYLGFERQLATYGDTPSYRVASHASIFSEQFLAGYRSLTVPLFWKLVPGSDNTLTFAQLLLSIACWLFLAWSVAGLFNRLPAKIAAYVVVLAFSLLGAIDQWDRDLLSESVNFSLFALVVGLSIRVVARPRPWTLAALLAATFFWVFARDSNAYALPAVAVVLVVALVRVPRHRRLLTAGLCGCAAIFVLSYVSAQIGHRADNPVAYLVGVRLPQDKPSALVWMKARGYTKPDAPNTTSLYRSYLLHHPGGALIDVLRNEPSYSPFPASANRLDSLYAPRVSLYEKSRPRWRIPMAVQRVLDPPKPLWVLAGLVSALALAVLAWRRGIRDPFWLVPLVLVLAAYPQTVVIWNVDAYEDDRHALGPALEVRLAIALALLFAAVRLVPLWLREAAEAKPDSTAPPAGRPTVSQYAAHVRGAVASAPRWLTAWLVFLVVVGIVGRVAYYLSPFGVPDADEAVGGLMAKHELHGQFISAFYWGQAYGGTLETWLAAPLVGIFGPSYLALRWVPIVLSGVAAVLVWRIGLRTLRSGSAALIAAGLAWCFPSFLMWKVVHFHVFYASSMVLGLLTVLQVLRMRERDTPRGMLLLGLVSGLAIWQSFQLVTIVPTALIWLAVRRRDLLRYTPHVVAGALVGALPALLSNIHHHWWSRDIGHPEGEIDYLHRFLQFFTNGLPISLDLRTPVTLHWFLWKPIGILVYVAVLGGFLWLLNTTQRDPRLRNLNLIAVIALVFPAIYALSPLTTVPNIAGYVIVLMPFTALLLVAPAHTAKTAAIISAAALFVMATSIAQVAHDYAQKPRPDFTHLGSHNPLPRSFAPLIAKLDELGIRRVFASYWIAYRLDFETDEHIIAADMRPEALTSALNGAIVPVPNDASYTSRHPQYAPLVLQVHSPAFVFAYGFDPPTTQYDAFGPPGGYRMVKVGIFRIYTRGARSQGTETPAS
jgi:Dolichyl-phosphate-mannose-protein mannosyltransferase